MKEGRWLLLMHQLPPKPDYFRVKIWRRLQGLGAVAIKNSVWALPFSAQASEDFQWLRKEITGGGGEASLCRAAFADGLSDDQLESRFRSAAPPETPESATRPAERSDSAEEAARHERQGREIWGLDHVEAGGRQTAEAAVSKLKARKPGKA